jgi:hypothetical protein
MGKKPLFFRNLEKWNLIEHIASLFKSSLLDAFRGKFGFNRRNFSTSLNAHFPNFWSIWLLFLATIVIISSWFSFKSGYEFYKYYSRNSQVISKEIVWTVKELATDRYVLNGHYFYTLNDKSYSGQTQLNTPLFKNQEAAKKHIKEIRKERKVVWYSSYQPEDSSIRRELPIKDTVYTIILWGLFFYFLGLGFYIRINSQK